MQPLYLSRVLALPVSRLLSRPVSSRNILRARRFHHHPDARLPVFLVTSGLTRQSRLSPHAQAPPRHGHRPRPRVAEMGSLSHALVLGGVSAAYAFVPAGLYQLRCRQATTHRLHASANRQQGEMSIAHRVVFLRHGESTWNRDDRHIGWTGEMCEVSGILSWEVVALLACLACRLFSKLYNKFHHTSTAAVYRCFAARIGICQVLPPRVASTYERMCPYDVKQ